MPRQLILGTAGHIDHGKTALVKLLTGTDCDRLPEEKARGITIELGFASLDLPDGTHFGIVDVPGHERFVRTMVAGASGIDIIMLVIAADEGVMPQTREHFDICRMLDVRTGLVVLTKADLVDADWLDLVKADVEEFVRGSFLEGAPIVPVSSVTGSGREVLIEALARCAAAAQPKSATDLLRLPVDRVFTIKGFGAVATGTLLAGSVRVGDEVQILPDGRRVRVRNIQVHDRDATHSEAGLRTAVNLQGLSLDEIRRGDTLAEPDALEPTFILDGRVDVLASAPRPLKTRARVRFLAHTKEIMARVHPMSADEIEPGQTGVVQIRLEEPAVLLPGDRFVLRAFSPVVTIGGGSVLHPRAAKHRKPYDAVLADLDILDQGDLTQRMSVFYAQAGVQGLPFSSLRGLLGATTKDLLAAYRKLLSEGILVRYDNESDRSVGAECWQKLLEAVAKNLRVHHEISPESPGLSRGELANLACRGVPVKLISRAFTQLEKEGRVEIDGDTVRLAGHKAGFAGEMAALTDRIFGLLHNAHFAPPTVKEIADAAGCKAADAQKVLDHLVKIGRAARINPTLYYDKEVLAELVRLVEGRLRDAGEIDAQSFKELTGLSRKFAIPLLEYLDVIKLTLRVGDKRVARQNPDR